MECSSCVLLCVRVRVIESVGMYVRKGESEREREAGRLKVPHGAGDLD